MDSDLRDVTTWSLQQGLRVAGLAPSRLEGRGIGMFAQRPIKAGEEVVFVPTSSIITVNCIPQSFKDIHQGSTVHGLLASFLSSKDFQQNHSAWVKSWPTYDSFKASIPFFWTGKNSSLNQGSRKLFPLPPAIGGEWVHVAADAAVPAVKEQEVSSMLQKQEKKVSHDFAVAHEASAIDQQTFFHNWFVVNTRCFFYDLPMDPKPKSKEDKMVLCPFLDFFNHGDEGCHVSYDDQGFSVVADRDYDANEEL